MKKELKELWEFLTGKKTYIVMIAGVGLAGLKYFDLIDPKLYNFILDVLAFLGLGAIRDAVNTILKDCRFAELPPEIPLPPVTIRK